ncbi:MAG TPA: CrcB family protein [Actinoplanes sp.]|jgi:CrcB protein
MVSPPLSRILPTISAGGVLGALTRYGIGVAWPADPAGFPWATWTINVTGCFLIGVLLTALPRPGYLRPLLGTGFLGGYTTFSTAIVDLQHVPVPVALAYLPATLLGALLAVWLGSILAERVTR